MFEVIEGHCLAILKTIGESTARTCITSPPYFQQRDYKMDAQIGVEATPTQYIANLVDVFREVRRVLTDDGTLWLNLGDTYAGNSNGGFRPGAGRADGKVDERGQRNRNGTPCPPNMKPKDLMGIPWAVAFALRDDGWYLRQDIIWHKTNAMPEPSLDRCTKAHEYFFLLSKSPHYHFDSDAIRESSVGEAGMRNKRSVWPVPTQPYKDTNFATFPPDLIQPCVLASTAPGDTVLDPFNGTGTTGLVSLRNDRRYVGIELNPQYVTITQQRLAEAHAPSGVIIGYK